MTELYNGFYYSSYQFDSWCQSSAYYNSTSLQNLQGTDLYDIIYTAVDDAMKNNRR